MFAVIFEVLPSASGYQRYLDIAAALRPKLDAIDGFISIERFKSLSDPGWVLSLSFWRDQAALVQWRGDGEHHAAQSEGRQAIFDDYRIRVVQMVDEMASGDRRPLIGLWEHATADRAGGKLYQSLTNADKHVALADLADTDAALKWRADTSISAEPQARVLCAAVLRDYGLFDRQQAPQHFPQRHR